MHFGDNMTPQPLEKGLQVIKFAHCLPHSICCWEVYRHFFGDGGEFFCWENFLLGEFHRRGMFHGGEFSRGDFPQCICRICPTIRHSHLTNHHHDYEESVCDSNQRIPKDKRNSSGMILSASSFF